MYAVSEALIARLKAPYRDTPNGRCYECPLHDGEPRCDPTVSLRCPMRTGHDEATRRGDG